MLYVAALGLWCIVALFGSTDPTAHLICISVTLCYMAAGSGRTYGRPWIFHVQMLLACGPLTVALALYGNPYYFGMAILNVLFFFSLKHISTGLQGVLVGGGLGRGRGAARAGRVDGGVRGRRGGVGGVGAEGHLA